MNGRWTALGAAAVLSLTLAACSAKTGQGTVTNRLSDRGTSGTETSAQRSRSIAEDGGYYAGADGQVTRRQDTGESEWEKLGRQLRESWNKMMDGAEDTARDVERGAKDAVQDTERAVTR